MTSTRLCIVLYLSSLSSPPFPLLASPSLLLIPLSFSLFYLLHSPLLPSALGHGHGILGLGMGMGLECTTVSQHLSHDVISHFSPVQIAHLEASLSETRLRLVAAEDKVKEMEGRVSGRMSEFLGGAAQASVNPSSHSPSTLLSRVECLDSL